MENRATYFSSPQGIQKVSDTCPILGKTLLFQPAKGSTVTTPVRYNGECIDGVVGSTYYTGSS